MLNFKENKEIQRINCHTFYLIGSCLAHTDALIEDFLKLQDPVPLSKIKGYFGSLKGPIYWITCEFPNNPFPPIVKNAAIDVERMLDCIEQKPNSEDTVSHMDLKLLSEKTHALKTVLTYHVPTLPIFLASSKGLFHPEDLNDRAHHHLPEEVRNRLSDQCLLDIKDSGRCLAFDLGTASVFHMMRAIEDVIKAYYEHLKGRTFQDDEIYQTWGSYIEALKKANADQFIVAQLYEIKNACRNPVCHPEVNMTIEEALRLFGMGIFIIGEMVARIDGVTHG